MALAQETDILLLDEPTTFLDVSHQIEVLDLLTDLNLRRGTTIVMVLHDINLAARYADHLFALRAGRLVASGAPRDVVTSDLVREVFGKGRSPASPRRRTGERSKCGCVPSHSMWLACRMALGASRAPGRLVTAPSHAMPATAKGLSGAVAPAFRKCGSVW
jgi:ABC-type methionine transport system ATPase subunit